MTDRWLAETVTAADALRDLNAWGDRYRSLPEMTRILGLLDDMRAVLIKAITPVSIDGYPIIESRPATLDDRYMTAAEVSNRLRVDDASLRNLRYKGEGIPWVKVGRKALYKVSDVLAAETAGMRAFSQARLTHALRTFPGLTTAQREGLLKHITNVLKE